MIPINENSVIIVGSIIYNPLLNERYFVTDYRFDQSFKRNTVYLKRFPLNDNDENTFSMDLNSMIELRYQLE